MLHALITKDVQEVKIHHVIQNTPQLKTLSPAKARKTFKAISFCAHKNLSKEHTNLNAQNYFSVNISVNEIILSLYSM